MNIALYDSLDVSCSLERSKMYNSIRFILPFLNMYVT